MVVVGSGLSRSRLVPALPGINTDTPYQSGTVKHRKSYVMEAVKEGKVSLGSKVGPDDVDIAAMGAAMEGFSLPEFEPEDVKAILDGCLPERINERTGIVERESWLVLGGPDEPIVNTVYLHPQGDLGMSVCFIYDPEQEEYALVIRELEDELIGINEYHNFTWKLSKDGTSSGIVTVAKKNDPIIKGKVNPVTGVRGAFWVNRFALDESAQKVREDLGEKGWWKKYRLMSTKPVSGPAQGDAIMRQILRAYKLEQEDRSAGRGTVHENPEIAPKRKRIY